MMDVIELKGVGEKTKKGLAKLGIFCVEDLYMYFPRQYEKMLPPISIEDIKVDEVNTLCVRLMTMPATRKVRNLAISTCVFGDNTGSIEAVYFNMPFISKTMKCGADERRRRELDRADPLFSFPTGNENVNESVLPHHFM